MQDLMQNILVGAIFLLKLAQATEIMAGDLALIKREPGHLLRSVLAADVITPLITLLVVLFIHPPRATEVGLALAAASPAAPLFISSAVGAGGRIAYVASLEFTSSLLAMFTTPLILSALAVMLGFDARISPLVVARQVAVALFFPTILGMFARAWLPDIARKIAPLLRAVGGCAFLLVILVVLAKAYPLLLSFGFKSYLAIVLIIAAALAAGQPLGPSRSADRTTLAMACASRNPGLAMLIAAQNFPTAGAVHVLIPYLFISSSPSPFGVRQSTADPCALSVERAGRSDRPNGFRSIVMRKGDVKVRPSVL